MGERGFFLVGWLIVAAMIGLAVLLGCGAGIL